MKKYREVFWSKLLAHNIFQLCQALWETPTGANISSLQTSFEANDSEITRAALQVERATATKSFGFAWSPTQADAGQQVTFWRDRFQVAKRSQDHFIHLIPSQLKYHGIVHAGLSIEFYKARLDDAWSNLAMVQDNAQV